MQFFSFLANFCRLLNLLEKYSQDCPSIIHCISGLNSSQVGFQRKISVHSFYEKMIKILFFAINFCFLNFNYCWWKWLDIQGTCFSCPKGHFGVIWRKVNFGSNLDKNARLTPCNFFIFGQFLSTSEFAWKLLWRLS